MKPHVADMFIWIVWTISTAIHHLTVELTVMARPGEPAREPISGAVAAAPDLLVLPCNTRARTVHMAS